MSEVGRAVSLAMYVHEGQMDKQGKPYILHPLRVMAECCDYEDDVVCAAVLHDTIEDSRLDVSSLTCAYEFNEEVERAVDALTRRPDEPYFDYVRRCKRNRIALIVKKADLKDNMRLSDDDKYKSRCERYKMALDILNS